MLLVITEIVLRFAGTGQNYDLFLSVGENWQVNQRAGAKYFSHKDIAIPQLIEQSFPKEKEQNTFRIFCLGGSSTAGFPYEVNINFPFFLKFLLQERTTAKIEMINLGLSAANSYTAADFTPQILEMKPDLILIYMGHNEFYGALGTGSAEFVSANRQMTRIVLFLRDFRLFQLFQKAINSLSKKPVSAKNLMESMIAKNDIPYMSDTYQITHRHFEENLREIIGIFNQHHVPVIPGTVVSNLADQIPLSSIPMHLTDSLIETDALKFFRQGTVLLTQGRYSEARTSLKKARDYDGTRFRAASEVNEIIRGMSRELDIPLADIENQFEQYSEDGIPGTNLFLEHLHPNATGYALIAQKFKEEIVARFPEKFEQSGFPEEQPEKLVLRAGITRLDRLIGEIIVSRLMAGAPFYGRMPFHFNPDEQDIVYQTALRHTGGKIFWDEAHYQLGDFYLKQNQYAEALAEYDAVRLTHPELYTPYFKIGRVAEQKTEYSKAVQWYQKALNLNPEAHFLYAKLGLVWLTLQQYPEAQAILEQLMEKERQQNRLSAEAYREAWYLLTVALAQNQQITRARDELQLFLRQYPDHPEALDLLQQVEQVLFKK